MLEIHSDIKNKLKFFISAKKIPNIIFMDPRDQENARY